MPNEIKIWKGISNRIIVTFPYNPEYVAKIKTIKGCRWHPEEKYWSAPYSDNILEKLLSIFNGERVVIDPSLYLDNLKKELISRKYSQKTIKAYLYYNKDFLKFVKKTPYEISNEDIREYLYYLVGKKNASASTLNIAISALKFYYGIILKRKFIYEIQRPKKDKKLPVILNRDEVSRILSAVSNIKHSDLDAHLLCWFESERGCKAKDRRY